MSNDPEIPPERLFISDLGELLHWYERNLCGEVIRDPRGHRVKFDAERFPYLIKLRNKSGGKLKKPLKAVEKIRRGALSNKDFGGFEPERAQTLPWLLPTITRPTFILKNQHLFIPGDELYAKEFDKEGYRYKILVCRRVSDRLLVPITSFPRTKLRTHASALLWPK